MRPSSLLQIHDEDVALDIDMAAEVCLSLNGQPPVASILLAIVEGLSGGPNRNKTQPSGKHRSNEGMPVYVDGEYRGNGESIPMTQEEFIKRTVRRLRRLLVIAGGRQRARLT
ncbi:MAG TPA: hypothetical protein VGN95_25175 [Pyrinomonadaceae bacterium]|jgi:hypothetical protein|nr:hypothetical protein [Pyrinomonadaceae bacterium]